MATVLMIVWRNWTSVISRLFLASRSWLRGASILKFLSSGWVRPRVRLRVVDRVEGRERVVGVPLVVVEADGQVGAGLDREADAEVPDVRLRVDGRAPAEGVRSLRVGRVLAQGAEQEGVVVALVGEDGLRAQLGVVALDRDVGVVLERPLDGVVQRQLAGWCPAATAVCAWAVDPVAAGGSCADVGTGVTRPMTASTAESARILALMSFVSSRLAYGAVHRGRGAILLHGALGGPFPATRTREHHVCLTRGSRQKIRQFACSYRGQVPGGKGKTRRAERECPARPSGPKKRAAPESS